SCLYCWAIGVSSGLKSKSFSVIFGLYSDSRLSCVLVGMVLNPNKDNTEKSDFDNRILKLFLGIYYIVIVVGGKKNNTRKKSNA
ncbi:MAG: hypothetical protein K5912_04065, partial [Alphaproteobacteria bacterium]|nr:hypothetical protein [Alphaproteobacteria bacterium]